MEQNKCSTEETKLQSDFEGQVAVSLHKKKKKKKKAGVSFLTEEPAHTKA